MPRVAVLGWPLRPEPQIAVFETWSVKQLESARPRALAGSMKDLIEVAALREMRVLKLRSLSHPLVVFTRLGEPPLSEADHDRLWQLFRLPAFEQVRDRDGRLLAWECESRDGFHFAPDAPARLVALAGNTRPCVCSMAGIGELAEAPPAA
ncbi:MAG: hypothetical protein C0504_02460 [Candidatus Solibacter sp.]|nr:hypothetical protein [Candidatus Solibacter sp.]